MAEDVAMVTIHEAAAWFQADLMTMAWEKQIPSIRIAATRYVPTAFLRKLREDVQRTLREYEKVSRYGTLEPAWSAAELAQIAEIREDAVARAMKRKPERRPKWFEKEFALVQHDPRAPEPERDRLAQPGWMTSAGTGNPHPLPIIVVEKMRELNDGELRLFLALYHLSLGTLKGVERIDIDEVVRMTGMHRSHVYRTRKQLWERGVIPRCNTASDDECNTAPTMNDKCSIAPSLGPDECSAAPDEPRLPLEQDDETVH